MSQQRTDPSLGFGARVLAVAALLPLTGFIGGAIMILGRFAEGNLWEWRAMSLPAAAGLTVGSFAVIVLGARIAGTKRLLRAGEVWRQADIGEYDPGPPLSFSYERDRRRYGATISPAGRGVMEVAALPVLMFLPVTVVVWEKSLGGNVVGVTACLVGLIVSALILGFGLYGRAGVSLGTVLSAWLPWAVFVIMGWPLIGAVIGFLAGTVNCVFAYRNWPRRVRENAGAAS